MIFYIIEIPKFRVERVNLKTYYRSLFHCILDDLSNNNHYTRSPCYILLKGRNRSCCKKFLIEFHGSIKDCLKKSLLHWPEEWHIGCLSPGQSASVTHCTERMEVYLSHQSLPKSTNRNSATPACMVLTYLF